jgi:hypothetical protein
VLPSFVPPTASPELSVVFVAIAFQSQVKELNRHQEVPAQMPNTNDKVNSMDYSHLAALRDPDFRTLTYYGFKSSIYPLYEYLAS